MINKTAVFLTIVILLSIQVPAEINADSAQVLPKGRYQISLASKFYMTTSEEFDSGGDAVDVAEDYNTSLDSSVFPALALVESAFAMTPGTAVLGDSVVDWDYDFTIFEILFGYGISDKVTVGLKIPYWDVKSNIDAELDTATATVGKNVALNTLAPFAIPGTVPLITDDILDLLSAGLDINGDTTIDVPGYGYDRFESWSGSGLSDIEAGLKYQYYNSEPWRLAFMGAIRLPTGETDDPDILQDYPLGDGTTAILLNFMNDYRAIEKLPLNFTLRYTLVLDDEQTRRIPDDPDLPITANKEKVDIDFGDVLELEVAGSYPLSETFRLSALYMYGTKGKDSVSGDLGFAYESLEEGSDYVEQVYKIGISYSTVQLFMDGKAAIPMVASLLYRDRFAGENVLKSQYLQLGFQLYF
jgi:hypothetical protein